MERGTVKYFKGSRNKMYGFIAADKYSKDVFFHFSDGKAVKAGQNGPILEKGSVPIPREGDVIVFKGKTTRKGPRAAVWAYGDDWTQACTQVRKQH